MTVVDADTGDPIPGVVGVALAAVNGEWIATLEIAKPDIELTVEANIKARS